MANVFNIVMNIFAWIALFIIVPIPLLIVYLYKLIVTSFAKIKYSDLVPFDASDMLVINDDPYQPLLNMGFMAEINGSVTLAELRALVQEKLLNSYDLSQMPASRPWNLNLFCYVHKFGGYYFKRVVKNIDVEELITETVLPRRHKDQSDTEVICEFMSVHLYEPYTYGKPLWNFKLIRIEPNEGEKTFLIFCCHHLMIDGFSNIHIIELLMGKPAAEPAVAMPKQQQVKGTFWKDVGLIASAPVTLLNYACSIISLPNPLPPVTGVSYTTHYDLFSLDLAKIKYIRKEAADGSTHVISILLTLLGSVLRRLLLEKGHYKSDTDLPAHIYMNSPQPSGSPSKNRLGNEWSIGAFKIPIRNSNILERLSETEKDYTAFVKAGTAKLMRRILLPMLGLIPVWIGRKVCFDLDPPVSTAWSALVSSSGSEYALLGKPVEHVFPSVGCTSPRLTWGTNSFSHSNKIEVEVAVNHGFIGSYAEVHRAAYGMINEELENLVQAVQTQPKFV